MQQTEKYKLNLPEGTDIVRIEDLNENINEIESILINVENEISKKQVKGDYAENIQLNRVVTNVSSLTQNIEKMDAKVEGISNKTDKSGSDIVDIKKNVVSLKENTGKTMSRCSALEAELVELKNKNKNLNSVISKTNSKTTENKNELSSLKNAHSRTSNIVGEIKEEVSSINQRVDKNSGDIIDLKSSVSALSSNLSNTNSGLEGSKNRISSLETGFNSSKRDRDNIKADLNSLKSKDNSVNTEISNLKKKDGEIASKASSAYAQSQTNKNNITSLTSAHSLTRSKGDSLGRDVISHNSRITSNTNEINKAKSSASAAMTKANQAFQSVSEGKNKLGAALTDMGVANVPSAGSLPSQTFDWFASSIKSIKTGIKHAKGTVADTFTISGLNFVPTVICVKQRVEFSKTTVTYSEEFGDDPREPWERDDRERYPNEKLYEILDIDTESFYTENFFYYAKNFISNKIFKLDNKKNSLTSISTSGIYSVNNSGFKFGILPPELITNGQRPPGYFGKLPLLEEIEKREVVKPSSEKLVSVKSETEKEYINEFGRLLRFEETIRTSCKMEYVAYE